MSFITCSQGHQNPLGARFCSHCGASLQGLNSRTPGITIMQTGSAGLAAGTRLRERYVIQYQLGQGGFGRTYLAEDTGRFNERVVIKELTPVLQGTTHLQKAEELFEREAAMLHKLQHPQIPRFWELFREGKQLFLVQDFIAGETYQSLLHEKLKQGECFTEAEIVQLLREILPVLSYLHHQGIVHRDISPDNIICRSQDKLPVLIDLGSVKQVAINVAYQLAGTANNLSANTSTRLGKVGYSPDEQIRLGIVAPYSDLYALGVTCLVLMSGKEPQQLVDPNTINWIWDRELNLSPTLRMILQRMLAPKPLDRFQSAEEIWEILEGHKSVLAHNSPRSSAPDPKTLMANNSGQGRFLDEAYKVPSEVVGWNWGAFLLPGVWCLTNQVWVGLFAWTDPTLLIFSGGIAWLLMGIILGVKGNEWAWRSRKWRSVAAFKAHQRAWTIAAFIIIGLLLFVLLFISLIVLGLLGSIFR